MEGKERLILLKISEQDKYIFRKHIVKGTKNKDPKPF